MKKVIDFVKIGLGVSYDIEALNHDNWNDVATLAFMHGVGAIAFDGIQRAIDEHVPIDIDVQTKLKWIGATHQQEINYKKQESLIASLAKFYQQHGIKMMVLKGWGLSLNYPVPSHRPCSDLDIYLFGEQERADRLVETELGVKIDNGHHHHTVFVYNGLTVENHYDFLNVYSHRSNREIEKKLKEICCSGNQAVPINGVEVYLPSADFNALFLLRHMAVEFAATGISFRQIIDWGVFVKNYHNAVKWDSFLSLVKEYNMHDFLDAVNYICYTHLGFDRNIFKGYGNESYGERVLADIFNPDNAMPKEKGILKYWKQRWHNWWLNRWKHQIVFSDSLLSTFFHQVFAHLMKPATLHH